MQRKARGSALITVLLIGAVLGLFGVSIIQLTNLHYETTTTVEEGNIATLAAQAGLDVGDFWVYYNKETETPYLGEVLPFDKYTGIRTAERALGYLDQYISTYQGSNYSFTPLCPQIVEKFKTGDSLDKGELKKFLVSQAIPYSQSNLYLRFNLTQDKVSKPFFLACDDGKNGQSDYLRGRNADYKPEDIYFDIKVYFREPVVGNVPSDAAWEAIKDGKIDGTESKIKFADFIKQNNDGWQAKYLAKDEAVPIKMFPDSAVYDPSKSNTDPDKFRQVKYVDLWFGSSDDEGRTCNLSSQARALSEQFTQTQSDSEYYKDILSKKVAPFGWGFQYKHDLNIKNSYGNDTEDKRELYIFEQRDIFKTLNLINYKSLDDLKKFVTGTPPIFNRGSAYDKVQRAVPLPLQDSRVLAKGGIEGEDVKKYDFQKYLAPSTITLVARCRGLWYVLVGYTGFKEDKRANVYERQDIPSSQIKIDSGEIVIESIGHYGKVRKPLQKRISRKALTPVNPVENTLSIYEQEVGL